MDLLTKDKDPRYIDFLMSICTVRLPPRARWLERGKEREKAREREGERERARGGREGKEGRGDRERVREIESVP
jgi:hypothetical protein